VPNSLKLCEGQRCRSRSWVHAAGGLPGVVEDGMPRRNEQRKRGTTRGSPRRSRTAKAARINRKAAKSRCAREWGGWGRLSDDGPGQHNPVRSEGPWGRARNSPERRCSTGRRAAAQNADHTVAAESTKDECEPHIAKGRPGAGFTRVGCGKATSEMPTLEPYWGKPAVRNLRGDDGNVGIIRSPVRAIVLPDRTSVGRRGATDGSRCSGRRFASGCRRN